MWELNLATDEKVVSFVAVMLTNFSKSLALKGEKFQNYFFSKFLAQNVF